MAMQLGNRLRTPEVQTRVQYSGRAGQSRVGEIRILLADDHTIIRSGLRLLFEQQPDFKVVAEPADGREAVELVSIHHPEIAVLDIGMPRLEWH
jgi:AmiR/NasT family two-component response regulator